MNKDVDVNHYSYEDLLVAFKIQDERDIRLDKMREKCEKVKETYPEHISLFYDKAYKIIETVNEWSLQNGVTNVGIADKTDLVEQIKRVPLFERMYVKEILRILGLQPQPQPQQPAPLVYTAPQAPAPGSLNSLKRVTQKQNLNINSCFRHNYYESYSTDYDYTLPSEIKNVISMRLASIELPNAWYLFSGKQTFTISLKLNGVETTETIVIEDGNYDNQSFADYLNTTFFFASGTTTALQYIECTIPDTTVKTTFAFINLPATVTSSSFMLTFLPSDTNNMMKTAGWTMGFRFPVYKNITSYVVSEGLFDGNGDRYLYVSLTDYQYNTNSTNIVGFDKSYMDEDILAKVQLTQGKLSLCMEDNQYPLTKRRIYNGPVNLRKIHVKILDAFGEVIDLNYMDFSITLELEILYESFRFTDVTG